MDKKNYKKRIFEIIQYGTKEDLCSTLFDYLLVTMIVANLFCLVLATFSPPPHVAAVLSRIEYATLLFFIIEYVLRLWTAQYRYPDSDAPTALLRFALSFEGLVDLFTILPYFMPFFLPNGIVAFRVLRVFRVFHLFRINAQYDSFNVVLDVLKNKWHQLFSSICMILIMMLASSVCMYSLEHAAQPDVFKNAFSGIWWSVSAILTVGYGDIYPVTVGGEIMAIIISFLGVGLVAIPTGIISAGFVEQYTNVKTLSDFAAESNEKYLMLHLDEDDHPWIGKTIDALGLPPELVIVAIIRHDQVLHPDESFVLAQHDLISVCRVRL
ncbi:MAG: ion transporter [Lachnospiraceae bacterium]|nr:ion transporter [Lachnospiraceae bacterium]